MMKIFVSPLGVDTNTGTIVAPVQSLSKALALVSTGDEIVFSGSTTLSSAVLPAPQLTLSSAPGERAVLTFTGTGDYSLLTEKDTTLRGLYLRRESSVDGNVLGIQSGCVVENCRVSSNSVKYDGIKILGSNVVVRDCLIHDCANQGIDDVGHDGHLIERNTIYHCANGIVVKGGGAGHVIRENYVYDCDYSGIQIGGTIDPIWQAANTSWQASGCLIENNTVSYSRDINPKQSNLYNAGIGGGIRLQGAISSTVRRNTLLNCGLSVLNGGASTEQKSSGILIQLNNVDVMDSDDALVSADICCEEGMRLLGNIWKQTRTVPLFRLGTSWLTESEFLTAISC